MPMVDQISTPCVRVCAIEAATSLCAGCGRSLKEIAQWSRMSEPERKALMAVLPDRLQRAASQS